MHAATSAPRALLVQAGRIGRDAHGRAAGKWNYDIIPEKVVWFSLFDVGLAVTRVKRRLSSLVMRRGDTPSTGHYQAMLYMDGQLMLADNCVHEPCKTSDLARVSRDAYVFFYSRAWD